MKVKYKPLTKQQWVVITLNLTVHVIMYYYYYATAGGAKIWVSSRFLPLRAPHSHPVVHETEQDLTHTVEAIPHHPPNHPVHY
jgi:hypothetical protein